MTKDTVKDPQEVKSPQNKFALGVLFFIASHHIFSSFVNSFTEWDYFDNRPPEYRFMQAAFGNKLLFLGIIFMCVIFNYRGLRIFLQDILRLYLAITILQIISPIFNGRDLAVIAPRSPGNYMPKFLSLIAFFALVSLRYEQKQNGAKKAK